MKLIVIILMTFLVYSCRQPNNEIPPPILRQNTNATETKSYQEVKNGIAEKRKNYFIRYVSLSRDAKNKIIDSVTDYWITSISNDLFNHWQNTPWDFNGTTILPQEGKIACGYFVTTILQAMDAKIQRQKLAICPSSEMMKSLSPRQKIRNLSYLDFGEFNETLKRLGKGVYIIGLDFHTGFIVNDGKENWFIHSNYIRKKGVSKETVLTSAALRPSKTRWLISLTGDKYFLEKWLRGK